MDKTRAIPLLAGAAMALSLAACQGMGSSDSGAKSSSSGAYPQSSSAQSAGVSQQQAASSGLVRDVQHSLNSRGYDPGAADGVYGSGTENALRRFQNDQKLSSNGQIDYPTLAALGLTKEAGAPQRISYQPTGERNSAAVMAPAKARQVQQNLADRGYDPGPVDGIIGPKTRDALRSFQNDQKLAASGRADRQTLAALGVGAGNVGTQTGQTPSDMPPQQGALPPTGAQAPGSAPEAGRIPPLPGQEAQPPASGAGQ